MSRNETASSCKRTRCDAPPCSAFSVAEQGAFQASPCPFLRRSTPFECVWQPSTAFLPLPAHHLAPPMPQHGVTSTWMSVGAVAVWSKMGASGRHVHSTDSTGPARHFDTTWSHMLPAVEQTMGQQLAQSQDALSRRQDAAQAAAASHAQELAERKGERCYCCCKATPPLPFHSALEAVCS